MAEIEEAFRNEMIAIFHSLQTRVYKPEEIVDTLLAGPVGNRFRDLLGLIADSETELESAKVIIADTEDEFNAAKARVAELEAELSDREGLRRQIEEMADRIMASHNRIPDLENRIAALEAENERLRGDLSHALI